MTANHANDDSATVSGKQEATYALAVEYHKAGRLSEAARIYRDVLAANPHFAAAHNNLANALSGLGRLEQAIEAFENAIRLDPSYAEAFYNRGNVHAQRGELDKAIADYRRTVAIRPELLMARYNLGLALCERGETEEAFRLLSACAASSYGSQISARDFASAGASHKRRHDQEQRAYLENIGEIERTPTGGPRQLADGEKLACPAINRQNSADAVSRRWSEQNQIVVIDDFLSPAALHKLRQFCWRSLIWGKVYDEAYLGATPEYGLSCPLLAQIADEMRLFYPKIFAQHTLRYLWAFKYDSDYAGIKLHADEAAVNVNFWITPDEANLDPGSGGLIVWDKAAPCDWSPAKLNSDVQAARALLAELGAKPRTIAYRSNRAVIFNSDLFHQTDHFRFKSGYLNRRINLTLLFGRRPCTKTVRESAPPLSHAEEAQRQR